MGDVVLKLPVREGAEAVAFGAYLNRFMAACAAKATDWGRDSDAPYLMVHSDPRADIDHKMLTFQENSAAEAFRSGWDAAARDLLAPRAN